MHALCNAIAYTLARHNEAEVGDGEWLCPAERGERLFREPPV